MLFFFLPVSKATVHNKHTNKQTNKQNTFCLGKDDVFMQVSGDRIHQLLGLKPFAAEEA